ncbi:MAG: type I DNA topoisomerase [Anaerolineales bacterium]|nr:type I DNA topoisomerase [Anaerolineales bacterium]MCB9126348.1 type I DNA topoisomerase [Ardenticatenales bacterium]
MKVVIVESPSKAKKIQGYLGAGWHVLASMGHVRDLPPKALGVDIEADFAPSYHVLRGKGKTISAIRSAAKEADALYLATDPDREGEAIAWHVLEAIGTAARGKPLYRVVFGEITQRAIRAAFDKPRQLDMALVDSQQARRVLDRLVGWKVSPVLRRAFGRSLSAGRVQSVAVRLVVERERAIEAFTPEQYWTLDALFAKQQPPRDPFKGQLSALLNPAHKTFDPKKLPTEAAHAIAKRVGADGVTWRVIDVEQKETQRRPPPPFITSTMQQRASAALKMAPKQTMRSAQTLYERGLITYMRTDSPFVAQEAQQAARQVIAALFGAEALPKSPPYYRAKGNAQEAHECIRPTRPDALPKDQKLNGKEAALYRLIWQRFIASQMTPARYDLTVATIQPSEPNQPLPYHFAARGRLLRWPGWLAVYQVQAGTTESDEEDEEAGQALPPLHSGEAVDLVELAPTEHWSQPPKRYTEPSLIKALEQEGIGRPSTYASIMDTIQQRGYVESQSKALLPTEAGRVVTDFLTRQFPDLLDLGFTRQMEEQLDHVAEGQMEWTALMADFYRPLASRIGAAQQAATEADGTALAEPCPECGAPLQERYSQYGKYVVCDDCGYKPGRPSETGEPCPDCGQPLVIRRSKRGPFIGCSGYPDCNYTAPAPGSNAAQPLDEESAAQLGKPCPTCGHELVQKSGRYGPFVGCSHYPDCKFIYKSSQRPPPARKRRGSTAKGRRSAQATDASLPVDLPGAGEPCPKCGQPMAVKSGRYGPFVACTGFPTCRHIHKG